MDHNDLVQVEGPLFPGSLRLRCATPSNDQNIAGSLSGLMALPLISVIGIVMQFPDSLGEVNLLDNCDRHNTDLLSLGQSISDFTKVEYPDLDLPLLDR